MEAQINFTRINNDTNGNPRYVCHFLNLLTDKDTDQVKQDFAASLALNPFRLTEFRYDLAVERARKIGGKRYHTKQYGGGIVFNNPNPENIQTKINNLLNN